MNYNTLRNKPTINYRELIGDSTVSEVGGITEEEFNTLMNTDLASYYTKAQIDELFARSFVYREKSGSIVTFDCPSTITTGISSVTSEIVAVQSGTGDPSPTNVRPFSGWSAVNVYDYKAYQIILPSSTAPITTAGLTLSYEGKGKFRVKGKSTSAEGVTFVINYEPFTIYDGADSYISLNNTIAGGVTAIFRNVSAQVDSWTFSTINRTSSYVGMRGKTTNNLAINVGATLYDTDVDFTFKVEIYSNDSKTAYTTALKDEQGNPLVCYGGQLVNENGVQRLVVDLKHADLSSLNWTKTDVEGNPCFYANLSDGKVASTFRGLCSTYKRTEDTTMSENGTIQFYGSERFGFSRVMIRDDNYASATASEFKSAVTGSIIYELATPQTISQDNLPISSQDGTNNLWADSGDVTVTALDKIIQG